MLAHLPLCLAFAPTSLAGFLHGGIARHVWRTLRYPLPPAAPLTCQPLPGRKPYVPMIFPVIGATHWHDSYNQVRPGFRHTGVDIAAPKLSPVLAPISGRIGFKQFSFWIVGDGCWQGWRVLGTHLNDDTPGTNDGCGGYDWMFAPNLHRGDRVEAGQLIGYVGNSGNATGPHLHLELHGRKGICDPTLSLVYAQHRSRPLPVVAHPEERPAPGEIRLDGCRRGFNPITRVLTLQMVARQAPGKYRVAVSYPRRTRVTLTGEQVEALGGPAGIRALHRDHVIRVYVTKTTTTVLASRVEMDPDPGLQTVARAR